MQIVRNCLRDDLLILTRRSISFKMSFVYYRKLVKKFTQIPQEVDVYSLILLLHGSRISNYKDHVSYRHHSPKAFLSRKGSKFFRVSEHIRRLVHGFSTERNFRISSSPRTIWKKEHKDFSSPRGVWNLCKSYGLYIVHYMSSYFPNILHISQISHPGIFRSPRAYI